MKFLPNLILILLTMSFLACSNSGESDIYEPYTGPLRILTNAVIEHSDSAIIRAKVITNELHEFSSLDKELPKGGYLEFYDKNGAITATLQSNYAYFTNEDQLWRLEGAVKLTNVESGETLNTEELHWNTRERNVFTDKFVRIETEDQILTGIGLTAKQDFSRYVIKNPQGIFNLDE
jgi:LPS export ABC transporter protein LptC